MGKLQELSRIEPLLVMDEEIQSKRVAMPNSKYFW